MTTHKHTAQYMGDGASAQIEIIETIDANVERYNRTLAIATFYWEAEQDWPDFVAQVTSVADRMFAEFNNEIEENVTQYIQFKAGGVL